MFEVNTEDLNYIFESAGQSVLVNDVPMNAIITNPPIGQYEEKYIHTLDRVSRGDMVTLEGEHYLCLDESITKRGGKYKTKIRHCNYETGVREDPTLVYVGDNVYGDPMYEEIPGELHLVPSFIETKSYSVTSGVWVTSNNEILVTMKEIAEYRGLLELNDKIEVMEKIWKITNILLDKKGLIILNCERQ